MRERLLFTVASAAMLGSIAILAIDLWLWETGRPTISDWFRGLLEDGRFVPAVGAALLAGYVAGVVQGGVAAHWWWSK